MRKLVSSRSHLAVACIAATFLVFLGSLFHAEEGGGTSYDRQESCLHLSLIPSDDTAVSPGDGPQQIEVIAEWHSWEIWVDSSTGEEESQNATSSPASDVEVFVQLVSGLGTLSHSTVTTDGSGRAVITYSPQSPGIDTVEASAGDSNASLDFTIGGTTTDDTWTYSHTEATLDADFSLADNITAIAEGETRMLLLTVHYETWDVLTNTNGETRIENLTRSPAAGASISWYAESGDGTVTGYETADSAGFAQGSITVGSSSTVARVDISYATGQSTSATLTCTPDSSYYSDPYGDYSTSDPYSDPYSGYDPYSDPSYYDPDEGTDPGTDPSGTGPTNNWYFSHSETVYSITNLAADGPTTVAQGDIRTITGQLLAEQWDVWTDGSTDDYRFNYSGPSAWTDLNVQTSDSSGTPNSETVTTDGDGWFSSLFTMGDSSATVCIYGTDQNVELANVSFDFDTTVDPSGTGEDDWTFIRLEEAYAIQDLVVDGPTYDLEPGTVRTVTGVIHWEGWEVWEDGNGNTETRNGSSEPSNLTTLQSVIIQGDGVASAPSLISGDDGAFSVTYTMGTTASRLGFLTDVDGEQFSTTVDFTPPPAPEPFWTFARTERTIALELSPGFVDEEPADGTYPDTIDARVTQTSWEVWEDGLGGVDIRNETTGPAIGALVTFSQVSGPGMLVDYSAVTDAGGNGSVQVSSGTSSSDSVFSAAVTFEGVSASGEITISADPWGFLQTEYALNLSAAAIGDPTAVDPAIPTAISASVNLRQVDIWQHRDTGEQRVRAESIAPAENGQIQFAGMGDEPVQFQSSIVYSNTDGIGATNYSSAASAPILILAQFNGLTATLLLDVPPGSGDVTTPDDSSGTGTNPGNQTNPNGTGTNPDGTGGPDNPNTEGPGDEQEEEEEDEPYEFSIEPRILDLGYGGGEAIEIGSATYRKVIHTVYNPDTAMEEEIIEWVAESDSGGTDPSTEDDNKYNVGRSWKQGGQGKSSVENDLSSVDMARNKANEAIIPSAADWHTPFLEGEYLGRLAFGSAAMVSGQESGSGMHTEMRLVRRNPETGAEVTRDEAQSVTYLKIVRARRNPALDKSDPTEPDPDWKPEDVREVSIVTLEIPAGAAKSVEDGAQPVKENILRPTAEEDMEYRVDLLPVEVVTPKEDSTSTGYVADDMVAATNLKIAKMEKSLDDQGSLDAGKDIDRFYLRIPGVANSNLGAGSVKVTTVENPDPDNYNETATVMNLTADGDDLVSGPMILVSDTVDDNHDQHDNADDDPTHLAQIGGKFRIESITIDGKESSSQIDLEIKEEKTVIINAVVFSDSGITTEEAEDLIETQVRERYAQVGLKIEVGSVEEKNPPYIPNRETDSSEIAIYESEELFGKYAEHGFWAVMAGRSADTPEDPKIFVFFCKKIFKYRVPSIPQLPQEFNGYAWHTGKMPNFPPYYITEPYNESGRRDVSMPAFANNCFISVSLAKDKPFTLAHEIGHLLTQAGHFEAYPPGSGASDGKKSQNLMRGEGAWGSGTSVTNSLDASKRIQQSQQDRINAHPAVKESE